MGARHAYTHMCVCVCVCFHLDHIQFYSFYMFLLPLMLYAMFGITITRMNCNLTAGSIWRNKAESEIFNEAFPSHFHPDILYLIYNVEL